MHESYIERGPQTLLERIDRLRRLVILSPGLRDEFSERLEIFDATLKDNVQSMFGDEGLRRALPEWHLLVGSQSPPYEIDPEAKEYILNQIEWFISDFEEELADREAA